MRRRIGWNDESIPEFEPEPPSEVEKAAEKMGIDLRTECPVCRSLEPCDCTEADRTFVRRTRFENDSQKVPRCPRCQWPQSVLYLPRHGQESPWTLTKFCAVWGCAQCLGDGLATVLVKATRG